ncbi:putative late blight resistance protein homolog R1A-3 [Coffea arabica]|uniref:Late blight resistance protein homolog R1A-3 n=1 Tax=Coffea arabica TaxID=13443 RepID=A0A6P6WKK6_COFAR|nr:putative late blight resistance protein homolog R1A-3 [Coffea arabica]
MANIPDAALGFILQNLKESVQYNAELIGGVKDNVKELCEDLETLRAFIREYTDKYSDNEILEKLASKIRGVVYRAEDAIETYISCASVQKLRRAISKAAHFVDYISDLRAVGKEIEKVSKDVQEIYQNRAALGFAAMQIEEISNRRQKKKKTPVVEEDNVVGFDDAAKEVIELLTGESDDQSDQLEVISIIGMLGLGKTTLAKKVLNDPKIEYEFYTRAFVNVSQEYERKEMFLKILGQFTQITDQMNKMSDEQLCKELHDQLKTRKYLIVMDDVWTNEAWDQLKGALPNNNKRSRVLITSRHKPVAVHANQSIDPYFLRFLYPEESRELLRRKVFGNNCCPSELEAYELRILQKCDGLPLAIVVVAGILVNHRDRTDWWKKVAEDVNDYVARKQEQSYDVIKLSYNHMPYYLKPCFLYLGVFREDFEIPVWKLVRLWIAEGFIPRDGCMSLEDIAEDYLEELVDRNLVMVGHRRLTGQIKTCRIHDTLRDFCKKEATKENLFQEIKRFDQAPSFSADRSSDGFRRLCVNAFVADYIKSKPSGEFVRSFLSFAKDETTLQPEHVSLIPKAFKLLRVLDARSLILTRFPTDLLYLVLLKYIAVSCNFKILPEKLSNLWNLQTLIVETSSRTLEIKADIWKLPQLRHVHTNASTSLVESKKELIINAHLKTLSTISPESCRAELFVRAPKLKKLGVCGKLVNVIQPTGQSSLFANLFKLEDLENLKLLNDDITFKLHALPQENMFPRKLTRLTLLNTLLDWKHMSTLGKLEKLEVLKLKDNAFQGELWRTEGGGFRNLKVLHIGSTNLVMWKALASHFPILRSLFLRHCTKLEAVPSGLGDIATLQEIDLYCTNSMVAKSARNIQVLKLKVQANDKNKRGAAFKLSVYPPDQ